MAVVDDLDIALITASGVDGSLSCVKGHDLSHESTTTGY
jgi:hypothetical protein